MGMKPMTPSPSDSSITLAKLLIKLLTITTPDHRSPYQKATSGPNSGVGTKPMSLTPNVTNHSFPCPRLTYQITKNNPRPIVM